MMRGPVFGLTLIALVICSSVFAGEGQLPIEADTSQKVQELAPPNRERPLKKNKHISRTQSRSAPSSLSLSSAETYAAAPSANFPVSSPAKAELPTTNSWTGFYVGGGAGVGAAQQ